MLKKSFRLIGGCAKEIFVFELIYRILSSAAYAALAVRLLMLSIRLSGYSYLTTKNVAGLLLKPYTILFLAVMLLLYMLIAGFENMVLIALCQSAAANVRLKLADALKIGMVRTMKLLAGRHIGSLALILLIDGWFNAGFLFYSVKHIKLFKELIDSYIGRLPVVAAAGALFLLLGVVLFANLFTVHFVTVEHHTGKSAAAESRRMLKSGAKDICVLLLANIALFLITLVILFAVTLLFAFLAYAFTDETIRLAGFLTVYDRLELTVMLIATVIGTVVNVAFITAMFYGYSGNRRTKEGVFIANEEREAEDMLKTAYRGRKAVAAAVCVFGVVGFFTAELLVNGKAVAANVLNDIQITAHRGYSEIAPENTLLSVEAAIDALADYVEIDVTQTADGVVVLLHDKSLKRTAGVNKNIWQVSYDELMEYDVGAYKGEAFAGTTVPTLYDVLCFAKGKVNFNIEIKYNKYNDGIVERVMMIIEELGMENECVITSSYRKYLEEVKDFNEDMATGLIISTIAGADFEEENIDFYSVNAGILTENIVAAIHRAGKEVHVWTVDNKRDLERMKQYNVDNIITNNPITAREIIYRNSATESIWELVRLAFD